MKTKIYNKEQLSFFQFYPMNIGLNHKQEKINRANGYQWHQIFMVNSGVGLLEINEQSFIIEKNDLFYIAANIPHQYYGIEENFKTTYLSFYDNNFVNIQKYYTLGDFGVYKNKNTGSFHSSIENLYNVVDTLHEVSTLCSLTFSAIISYFDEACKKDYSPIENVYNYIEENYSKMITLDDILSVYPYSKTMLCREFKEKYNKTIFEMLTNIRLRHAQNMINSNPYIKLQTVASSCGFNDISYFCKMYKRFYKCSPKSHYNINISKN